MSRKDYFLLYLISAVFFSILTFFIQVPGYMDAEYYYAGGIQIVSGHAEIEPYIWNYLTTPTAIPTASFSYWMPLTSIISAAGMFLRGSTSFSAGRLLFVLLAGLIPLLSARFAEEYCPVKGSGWIAGFVSIFAVYYLPYFTVTDSFIPYMLLGGFYIFVANKVWKLNNIAKKNVAVIFGFGVIAGLLNLTRAEGIIWSLLGMIIIGVWYFRKVKADRKISSLFIVLLLFLSGYLIIMSGWIARNLSIHHSLFSPGGQALIWATGYDDIFFFDPSQISPERFLSQGIGRILGDRMKALGNNLKSLIAVNFSIILLPFITIGLWKTRNEFKTRLVLIMFLVNLGLMSIVFPFAGYRGGFLHSNSNIQTFLWGMVPLGLFSFIQIGVKLRNWRTERAWKMFGITTIVLVSALSGIIFVQKLKGSVDINTTWNNTLQQFQMLDNEIVKLTGDQDSVILVNDPPGFFLATERMAIVNPSDGMDNLLKAAEKFNAKFFILDENNVNLQNEIKEDQNSPARYRLITKVGNSDIYEIKRP